MLSASNALNAQRFEHYKIDLKKKKVGFFESIERIEIIPLEETKNSLTGQVYWYLKLPNGFAITDKETKTVIIFDEQGNHVNTISKYGLGPEEYGGINTVWFKDGTLELFNGIPSKLQRYTEGGEYMETISGAYGKEIWAGAITPYGDGYVFNALDMPGGDKAGYGLVFTDKKLNLVSKAFPIKKPHPWPLNLNTAFRRLGDTLFYKRVMTDTVMVIQNGITTPLFKFDFGDDWVWNDPKSLLSGRNAREAIKMVDKVFEVNPIIGRRYIMLSFHFDIIGSKKGFINRATGEFFQFDMRKKDKEDYVIQFLEWEGEHLVTSMLSLDFEEFIGNLKEDVWSIAGGKGLDDVLSSENPLIMKIKFK